MIADSGAERHIICGKDVTHVQNRRPLENRIMLETANGETAITEEADTICAGIRLYNCLVCPTASSSALATILLTDDGWSYLQSRSGATLTGPSAQQVDLVHEGDLYILSGSFDSPPVCSGASNSSASGQGGMQLPSGHSGLAQDGRTPLDQKSGTVGVFWL